MKTILLLFIIVSCSTAQPPPQPKPTPDMVIKAAVEETLLLDPRIFPIAPQVEVRNGIVTLRGKVAKPEGRVAAEQDTLNTKHVRSVINLVNVSIPGPKIIKTEQRGTPMMNGESDIKLKAEMALEQSLTTEQRKDIDVDVEGDVVVLKGEVKNNFIKEKAWFADANVKGVDEVRNELKVRPETVTQKDQQLEEEINYGLMWNSKIEWLDDKIDVTVKDRVAMLNGEVDSQEEKKAILSEVKEAGVRKVIDRIKVL